MDGNNKQVFYLVLEHFTTEIILWAMLTQNLKIKTKLSIKIKYIKLWYGVKTIIFF